MPATRQHIPKSDDARRALGIRFRWDIQLKPVCYFQAGLGAICPQHHDNSPSPNFLVSFECKPNGTTKLDMAVDEYAKVIVAGYRWN